MHYTRHWLTAMLILILLPALAQRIKSPAGTWKLEAEDPSTTAVARGDEIEIVSPAGATLWFEHLMQGNTIIEYDARIVSDSAFLTDKGSPRISDLNCFWMADRCGGYGGKFANNYALRLYYMGYGGNWNTTTRFRRYTGYPPSTDSTWLRPVILREYTDPDHLLQGDHTYHIRLEAIDGRIRYIIDGETLVDYIDPHPLTSGYFGFRTTLAHAVLSNFHYTCSDPDAHGVPLHWIGAPSSGPATFGVPFAPGDTHRRSFVLLTDKGQPLPIDHRPLALWQDGSSKWHAFTTVIPAGTDSCRLLLVSEKESKKYYGKNTVSQTAAPSLPPFSLTLNNTPQPILRSYTERQGQIETVHRYEGKNFILRAYTYRGSNTIKLVHTLLVDSTLNASGLKELSLHFRLPLTGKAHERYVQFDGLRPMSVQPLIARRPIDLDKMDSLTCLMLKNIAQWDDFRLSQLSPNAYSIRKRTTSLSPWIGTKEGHRSQ